MNLFCIFIITPGPFLILFLRPTDIFFLFIYKAVGYASPTSVFNSLLHFREKRTGKNNIVCKTASILTVFLSFFYNKTSAVIQ